MADEGATFEQRLAAVRARIAAAGGTGVGIVAVTKGFGPEAVEQAIGTGVVGVGENYAQELLRKAGALGERASAIEWHFIGRLQTNKIRKLAPIVGTWQSVDRPEVVDELARRAPGARVLVQVNCSGEPQKGGVPWGGVVGLVDRAREAGLDVRGLMGVGPDGPPEGARPGFRRLVELAAELGLPERSIGMSHDLEVAVGEGATMVRIGRDLFGPRPARPPV